MQAKSLEAEPQYHVRSFGGISAPAQGGIEHIAEFPAGMRAAAPEQHNVAGQLARLAHLSAERKRLPLIGEFRARPLPRNPLDDVIEAHRLERHVPADIVTAAVGKQGVGVAYGQRAQQQPLTADGVRGAQRPGMGSRHVDHPATSVP